MSQAISLNGSFQRPSTSNTSVPPPPRELSTNEKLQAGGLAIIVVFGVAMNMTVILLVVLKKIQKSSIILLVVNMAFADLLSLLLEPSLLMKIIITGSDEWFGDSPGSCVLCKVFGLLVNSLTWVSLLTLLVISFERLKAVSSTVQLFTFAGRNLASLIAVTWAVSFALNVIYLVDCDVLYVEGFLICTCTQRSILIVVSHGLYLVTVVCTVTINLVIIRRLVHSQAAIHLPAAQQERRSKRFRSAIRMVLSSLLVYAVCVTPLYVYLSIVTLSELNLVTISWKPRGFLLYFIFYLNYSLGPIVYFVFLDEFRLPLRSIICVP
ncbi:blue-sensitive opsin [Nematostella vectensis]|uniref:blue-sensitive opsin n=1 Tax=Nematostella vectensis TaxID=45351 RepID=UPI0020773C36|nr:blue-sensitive opsin [Nematostella vectensis]